MSITPKPVDSVYLKAGRSWIVSVAPEVEPITVDDVKEFARIDGNVEDTLIEGFISAVREATEMYLGRALIQQTIIQIMNYWPSRCIELPQPPLISISSVVTRDEDDTETTYSSDNYYAVIESIPGQLVLKQGVSAPSITDRDIGAYKITYLAGYGEDSTDVPYQIREAMKLWATEVYENRAITTTPPPQAMPLLDLYRVIKY